MVIQHKTRPDHNIQDNTRQDNTKQYHIRQDKSTTGNTIQHTTL